MTRLKAAPKVRREQWLFIERADVLCERLGRRNKAGETTRIVFFLSKTAVLWKPRCKRLALLRAQYSSLPLRFGYIHDGRWNFSELSDTVFGPTAEAESSIATDIWKTVSLNEALQQSNIGKGSAEKKQIAVSFLMAVVSEVMQLLVLIAPSYFVLQSGYIG